MSRVQATPKEWAIAIGGGLALSAGLVLLLRGGGNVVPPPDPVVTPPAPVAALPTSPAPPAAPPTDLTLTGLRDGPDGGMAIIETGKRQYMLRPGRSLPGGLKLLRVEPGRAILAGPAGEMVLAFPDGKAGPAGAAPTPPGGDPTPWRLALNPVRSGGGITGWRLDSLAGLPQLTKAGFKIGDVLISVDGTELISEEKIMELPQELAANGRVAIALKRDQKAMELIVSR
jgi:hypothetical protein